MIQFSGKLSKNFSQEEYHAGSATVYMFKETIVFIRAIQSFRNWLDKPMYVVSWYRTARENAAVGGIENSNHKTGTALDWHLYNHDITREEFIRYATKWGQICKSMGCVGEAGIYKNWVHFGIQNKRQAVVNGHRFYHWDSRSGKQINMPFKELIDV